MTDTRRLVDGRDLAVAVRLAILAPVAWAVPPRHWGAACARLAAVFARAGKWPPRAAHLAAVLDGRDTGLDPAHWPRAHLAEAFRADVMLLRCQRPGAAASPWTPPWRLDGGGHLDAALAAGTGAVLWVAPFVYSDLMAKMIPHLAGYRVHHLSRFSHGFSETRAGMALLNPLRTRVEERFLASRQVIGTDGPVAALRALARRLAGNGLVSFALGHRGRRVHAVPFLGGWMELASGAADLALRAGAPLLPVIVVREADGTLAATVGAPLDLDGAADRDGRGAAAAREFARRIEPAALAHPAQVAWHTYVRGPGAPPADAPVDGPGDRP
ncbi:MAG: hypothetical protein H6907_05090 [Hyphomicrobiales bacterium]|nr:hypothetical protein [Hyphomicrobiales bacterium]